MEWYESYYSMQAWLLDKWSFEENNRIKASKLKNKATMMESKYRSCHVISRNEHPLPRWGLRKQFIMTGRL